MQRTDHRLHESRHNHSKPEWYKEKGIADVVTPRQGLIYKIKRYKQDIPVGPATFGGVVTSETS